MTENPNEISCGALGIRKTFGFGSSMKPKQSINANF